MLICSEFRVNNIFIQRLNVFDSTSNDWFFAASLANSLHFVTREFVIEDELLFKKGDIIDENLILETEKNLRALDIFSKVEISLDSLDPINCDIYVLTKDRWSTNPSLLFGTGGEAFQIGGRIEEFNFLGFGTYLGLETIYRSENDTRLQTEVSLFQRRLFRSVFSLKYNFFINRFRTQHNINFWKPYFSRRTENSYGITIVNHFGKDFYFHTANTFDLMNFYEKGGKIWYSHSWFKEDRLFVTALLDIRKIWRGDQKFARAFDNSARFFLSFSSISEEYHKLVKVNKFSVEDIVVGGWGSAILGVTRKISSDGVNSFYLAGIGEKSYLSSDNKLYLFARLAGGSSFASSNAFNTYQEFSSLMFYRFHPNVLFVTQVRQQSVWNWYGIRQLLLDNEYFLRGYRLNDLSGDNRINANLELRFFPDLSFWIFSFSAVAFYDGGCVWKQNTKVLKSKWHNALGFGIRIHNDKTSGKVGTIRIDFAFNFDKMKFAEVIITSEQLFSAFKSHKFELPSILGEEFEYE
ncbi:MAG: hypothetical protein N2517_00195 [Ignavibacteria bacterium]|nr:hypothetical protein [Ignavibacteria bacterium]